MAQDGDGADRGRHRHRAGLGRHHLVADGGEEALGRDIGVVDGAVAQDQAELVAGEATEHVAAAQPRPNPPRDLGDDGVGDVKAEGIVDARQMVDADQHEGAGGAEARTLLDGLGERCDQMGAVELTGQRVVPRQLQQLLVAGVPFIVDADDALRTRRPAVGAGKPATGLLDPDHRRRGHGAHAIFDPIGNALSARYIRGPGRAHPCEPNAAARSALRVQRRSPVRCQRCPERPPPHCRSRRSHRSQGPRRMSPGRARRGCWQLAGQGASHMSRFGTAPGDSVRPQDSGTGESNARRS